MVRVSRGLTLFEILVALAIIVTLASLVLPTYSWMTRFRSLENARDDVEALYLRARAHAAVNGRPIGVHLTDSALEANWFEAEAMFSDESESPEEPVSSPLATWSKLRLQDEINYRIGPVQNEFTFESPLSEVGDPPPEETERDVAPVLLAIFLSDGTAISRERLTLMDERGRTTDLVVDELSGRPVSREPTPPASPAIDESDEDGLEETGLPDRQVDS